MMLNLSKGMQMIATCHGLGRSLFDAMLFQQGELCYEAHKT